MRDAEDLPGLYRKICDHLLMVRKFLDEGLSKKKEVTQEMIEEYLAE